LPATPNVITKAETITPALKHTFIFIRFPPNQWWGTILAKVPSMAVPADASTDPKFGRNGNRIASWPDRGRAACAAKKT